MKRLFYMAAPLLLLAGCASREKAASADSDSIAEAEIIEAVEAVRNANYITKDGIGDIMVGSPVNTIPDSLPGLYSHKENGASQDAVTVTFSDGNGEQFVAYDFGEGNIDVINLIGTDIKVNVSGNVFGIGDKFGNVLSIPGIQPEWIGYDDGGMWYWTWNGIWFAPSQQGLDENLSRKLYNSQDAPASEDFSESVTVGFVGTGLPF